METSRQTQPESSQTFEAASQPTIVELVANIKRIVEAIGSNQSQLAATWIDRQAQVNLQQSDFLAHSQDDHQPTSATLLIFDGYNPDIPKSDLLTVQQAPPSGISYLVDGGRSAHMLAFNQPDGADANWRAVASQLDVANRSGQKYDLSECQLQAVLSDTAAIIDALTADQQQLTTIGDQ